MSASNLRHSLFTRNIAEIKTFFDADSADLAGADFAEMVTKLPLRFSVFRGLDSATSALKKEDSLLTRTAQTLHS